MSRRYGRSQRRRDRQRIESLSIQVKFLEYTRFRLEQSLADAQHRLSLIPMMDIQYNSIDEIFTVSVKATKQFFQFVRDREESFKYISRAIVKELQKNV